MSEPSELAKRLAKIAFDDQKRFPPMKLRELADAFYLEGGLADLEARLEAAEGDQSKDARYWRQKAERLEKQLSRAVCDLVERKIERDEAERLLRLAGAHACGYDTGDQTLEFLRRNQSPELADISIAIDLRLDSLQREIQQLRERCASDPWWWAFAEYLDEGWSGPFETREEAEADAAQHVADQRGEHETPEFTFRQHRNSEGCAENERLQRESDRLKAERDALRGAATEFARRVDDGRSAVQDGYRRLGWTQEQIDKYANWGIFDTRAIRTALAQSTA